MASNGGGFKHFGLQKILCLFILSCVTPMWTFSLTLPRPRSRLPHAATDTSISRNYIRKPVPKEDTNISRRKSYIFGIVKNTPTNSRRVQMCSRTNNYLQIFANGIINGTHDASRAHTRLIMESMTTSVVRIRGEVSQKYIAMNSMGKLYAASKPSVECLFKDYQEENQWQSFSSYFYGALYDLESGWLISIKKNGKIKRAKRTYVGEKSTQFMVVYL